MITGISHANIRVNDIDRCLPFYRDVLGLTVTWDERGQNLDEVTAQQSRRAVFLRWAEGPAQSFVVLQSFPPEVDLPKGGFMARLSALGLNHFGFWVDDLEPIMARARAAGTTFVRDAAVDCIPRHMGYADPSQTRCFRTIQLADPENNVVQLDQWLLPL